MPIVSIIMKKHLLLAIIIFSLIFPIVLAASSDENPTPLIMAVKSGRDNEVAFLLQSGEDPNRILFNQFNGSTMTAFSLAIERGEFAIARQLLDSGADGLLLAVPGEFNPLNLPLLEVPLNERIWRGLGRMKDNAISPDWSSSKWALQKAAQNGSWKDTVELLKSGTDVNSADIQGVTALMAASWHGHYNIAALLLSNGALSAAKDIFGANALGYAIAGGHIGVVNLLLETNLDVFMQKTVLELSPYFWALAADNPAVLIRLAELEVPFPSAGKDGITLLMMAAWLRNLHAIQILLPMLTDAGAVDNAGRSALEWCAAAFKRDRLTGMESGRPSFAHRNYPAARLLARRTKLPNNQGILVSPDIRPGVMAAWSLGNTDVEQWTAGAPSPIPDIPGNGDAILYSIFRDEEQE